MRGKEIIIKGLHVSIVGRLKADQRIYTHAKRIVSPEWIQLWFVISEKGFDQDLWLRLSEKDKDFMGYCVHACNVHSPEFEKALARECAQIHQRLLIIEGSIANGNLNRMLVDEYKQIVDKLAASFQIGQKQATNLKKRIERTYDATQKAD
jgi:predicted RNA-binding protein